MFYLGTNSVIFYLYTHICLLFFPSLCFYPHLDIPYSFHCQLFITFKLFNRHFLFVHIQLIHYFKSSQWLVSFRFLLLLTHPLLLLTGKIDGNQVTQAESKQLVSCLLTLIDGVDTSSNTHSSSSSGGSRGGGGAGAGARGGGVFIIATSSKPNNIDPAMRRPGVLRYITLLQYSASCCRLMTFEKCSAWTLFLLELHGTLHESMVCTVMP